MNHVWKMGPNGFKYRCSPSKKPRKPREQRDATYFEDRGSLPIWKCKNEKCGREVFAEYPQCYNCGSMRR